MIRLYKIYKKQMLVSLVTLLLSAAEGQKALLNYISDIASAWWRNKDF